MLNLKRRWGFLRAFLVQGRLVWFTAATIIVLTVVVAAWPDARPEVATRWLGLTLQTFGLVIVLNGLRRLYDHFHRDQQPWLSMVGAWLRLVWSFFVLPKPRNLVISPAAATAQATAFAPRVRVGPGPKTPLDERVRLLEDRAKQIEDEIDAVNAALSTDVSDIRQALKAVQAALQVEIKEIKTTQREVTIGDLGCEMAGVIFVLVGIIFATVPEQFSDIMCALQVMLKR